jgi:FHS family L-fucose permease-like MFS transporter
MKRNYYIVALIMLIFFVISFLTNVIGPLIPDIIKGFNLSLNAGGVVAFRVFYRLRHVMSIPIGDTFGKV